ncbi:ABC transporter substrate-binding protein [Tabrizicola sp.]|uniref:ABC transporter substrate-binding protein n=1 Tax=Tabrizicola sp. TaxID=2005166 RepID=UPI002FDCE6B3
MVTRRALLAAMAGAMAAGRALPAGGATAPRIAAIDWAMAESAMALGHPPLAVAELKGLRRVSASLPPETIIDLGLRGAPNLEALSLSAPDLILSSSYYSFIQPQLERIAPVLSQALYVPGEDPLPKLTAVLPELAEALDDPGAASPVLTEAEDTFDGLAGRLAGQDRPFLLMEVGDARHVRIFGGDSLYGGALYRLGRVNAWTEGTQFAFNAPVPMERLAGFPEAVLVIVGEVPVQARRSLERGVLWNRLAPVVRGDVLQLPEINAFGGLPSALRFGAELALAAEGRG